MPVKGVAEHHVRREFYRLYIDTEEDKKKSADAQKSEFRRTVQDAIRDGLVCGEKPEVGQPVLWFRKAGNTDEPQPKLEYRPGMPGRGRKCRNPKKVSKFRHSPGGGNG